MEWTGEITRLTPLQPRDVSLKFLLPADVELGVFAVRIRNGGGVSKTFLLNVPDPWWCQGDMGTKATAGGKVRVLGKNLGQGEAGAQRERTGTVLLKGPKTLTLPADGNSYSLVAALPPDLPAGRYELRVHSGWGGPQAWSKPLALELVPPDVWPALTVNVMELGATGRGVVDDTKAIAAALEKLQANGGGVLYFPRGRYLVSDTLKIPERTVLRGERRELCCIAWPDREAPLPDMLVGTHSFAIEELSLYCTNYGNFLSTDVKSPDAGNIRLHRLRVVANRFRGHMYSDAQKNPNGPGQAHARRCSIASCRTARTAGSFCRSGAGTSKSQIATSLPPASCSTSRGPEAHLANNVFRLGRFGGYWLAGCDGVVFEDNRVLGQDLSSWGGGINCLDGSSYSQHVYFARNTQEYCFGGDNEMTTDAPGGAYFGKVAKAEGTTLVTAEDPNWSKRDWRGAVVAIVSGTGMGQYRRVAGMDGRTVEVDRPWDVRPTPAPRSPSPATWGNASCWTTASATSAWCSSMDHRSVASSTEMYPRARQGSIATAGITTASSRAGGCSGWAIPSRKATATTARIGSCRAMRSWG